MARGERLLERMRANEMKEAGQFHEAIELARTRPALVKTLTLASVPLEPPQPDRAVLDGSDLIPISGSDDL